MSAMPRWAMIFIAVLCGFNLEAKPVAAGSPVKIQDLTLNIPEGWSLNQEAADEGATILGFANGDEYLTFIIKGRQDTSLRTIFLNNQAQLIKGPYEEIHNDLSWQRIETKKYHNRRYYQIAGFMRQSDSHTYFGYTRTTSAARSKEIIKLFLSSLH